MYTFNSPLTADIDSPRIELKSKSHGNSTNLLSKGYGIAAVKSGAHLVCVLT